MFFFLLLYAQFVAFFGGLFGISCWTMVKCFTISSTLPCSISGSTVPAFKLVIQSSFSSLSKGIFLSFDVFVTLSFQFHALMSHCPVLSFVPSLPLQIIPYLVFFFSVRSRALSNLSHVFFVYTKYNSVLDERVLECSKFTCFTKLS